MENTDREIKKLVKELYERYSDFVGLDSELDDEWYIVEQWAKVGLDRSAAKKRLEEFINKLEIFKNKT